MPGLELLLRDALPSSFVFGLAKNVQKNKNWWRREEVEKGKGERNWTFTGEMDSLCRVQDRRVSNVPKSAALQNLTAFKF